MPDEQPTRWVVIDTWTGETVNEWSSQQLANWYVLGCRQKNRYEAREM